MKIYQMERDQLCAFPAQAGVVVGQFFNVTIPKDAVSGDIVEIAVLPNDTNFIDAKIINSVIGVTGDVGFMTGRAFTGDQTRTCGDELFPALDTTKEQMIRVSSVKAFHHGGSIEDVGIGFKISSGTSNGGSITIQLLYAA